MSVHHGGRPAGVTAPNASDTLTLRLAENTELSVHLPDANAAMTEAQKEIARAARSFLEFQYAEIKDLATKFLTVIAGVLTLSVAFSEKIINFNTAGPGARNLMVAIWALCFLASALGGGAIFVIYNAAILAKQEAIDGNARYLTTRRLKFKLYRRRLLQWSQWMMTAGGLSFGLALAAFTAIGIMKVYEQPMPAAYLPKAAAVSLDNATQTELYAASSMRPSRT